MRWLLLIVVLPLAGCVAKQVVVVTDATGAPVQGANVEAVSPSMNVGPAVTNAKGVAALPINPQGTKWVQVSKPGYTTAHEELPSKWPMNVTLEKQAP